MYVIKIWERLIDEFDGHVPNLVFVGKFGWQIDELQEYLAEFRLPGRTIVHI